MTKLRIAVAALAATLAVSAIACGTGTPEPDYPTVKPTAAATKTTKPTTPATTRPTTRPTPTAPETSTPPPISAEQRNATQAADNYLSGQSFSRKGLIGQLKYEGYSTKASTAAVDSLNVDWKAQAAASATNYLDGQAFSRKGLIDQLRYEGFTKGQAEYGVKKAGL